MTNELLRAELRTAAKELEQRLHQLATRYQRLSSHTPAYYRAEVRGKIQTVGEQLAGVERALRPLI